MISSERLGITVKKLLISAAATIYKLVIWAWAWTREFMFVGAAIFGAQYDGAPIAAALLCAFIWFVFNMMIGLQGEKATSPVVRDFMIRHKAGRFIPVSDGHPPRTRVPDDHGCNPTYYVKEGNVTVDSRTGQII